jgi:hypothetical protein
MYQLKIKYALLRVHVVFSMHPLSAQQLDGLPLEERQPQMTAA